MLTALPYHQTATSFFQTQPEVWQFFSNTTHRAEQLQEFKTELLKNSYKFDPVSEPALFEKITKAKEILGMDLSVTAYQAENTEDTNASIVYIAGDAHIIFSGRLIQLLTEEELLAIIGHELSHILLYTQIGGSIEVSDRIIKAIGNNPNSTPAHYETARLFRLYTEIFCDRGAYLVTGSYSGIISALVKMSTGLQSVNSESYIKQAEEIFLMDGSTKASGITHPENFIRARAISLWKEKGAGADPIIQEMIEGNIGLDELDIFRQQHLSNLSEKIVKLVMQPPWMQTALTIALAKNYFPLTTFNEEINSTDLAAKVERLHPNLQDYFSYVLYDFATADSALEDIPLGYCFFLSEELKIANRFSTTLKKERKLTDKKVNLLKQKVLAEFHKQKELPTA
jgi:hypothetical protein